VDITKRLTLFLLIVGSFIGLQITLGVTKITFGENLFLFGALEITFVVLGAGLFMNKTGQERTLFLPC
jgi:hypothetical protein